MLQDCVLAGGIANANKYLMKHQKSIKQGQYFNFMSQWFQSQKILLQQMIDNQKELT